VHTLATPPVSFDGLAHANRSRSAVPRLISSKVALQFSARSPPKYHEYTKIE